MTARFKYFLLLIAFLGPGLLMAGPRIHSVRFDKTGSDKGRVTISFKGNYQEDPELSVNKDVLQLALPNTVVWPKLEKKVSVAGNFDSTLMAYQFNKQMVRVRMVLPKEVIPSADQTSVSLRGNQIFLDFPIKTQKLTKWGTPAKVNLKRKSDYDESFLDNLLREKNETILKKKSDVPKGEKESVAQVFAKMEQKLDQKDKVKTRQSSTQKEERGGPMSFLEYFSKFAIFLVIVLGLFFVLVKLFKKGVFNRGKLGFLNSTSVITVLNTTYIAPKRSLMLIKVYEKVFLISNSESGISILSEIDDVPGLLKKGEKDLAGSNFDSELITMGQDKRIDQKVKLKDDSLDLEALLNQSEPTKKDRKQEKTKLADQIKQKVKTMKAIQ